ncbi:MAG: N-acetylmuramoyl-L-alanine amidase [Eubacteriales bacterium]
MTTCNSGNYTKRRTGEIQYLVLHYTANNGDTAQNNATYFANNVVYASVHYFVDESGVVQSVDDGDTAWHCGASSYVHPTCRNGNSIGIEMCSRKDDNGNYYIKDETVANALELTKKLMETYGIPAENVVRHYDVTGKSCPAPWVLDTAQWTTFKTNLETEEPAMTYYQTIQDVPDWATETVEKLMDKGYLQGDETGLNLEHNALRNLVINDRAGLYNQ